MKTFESINHVPAYEKNGTDCLKVGSTEKVTVKNHWNTKKFVVIEVDGVSYTVSGESLQKAIDNAMNAHKF